MTDRIRRLLRRYSARHLTIELGRQALTGPNGTALGTVERIRLRHDRLQVSGHASAERVALELGGRRRVVAPEPGAGRRPGFRLDLPFLPGEPVLVLETATGALHQPLPRPGRARLWIGRALLLPGFAWRGARALPSVIRWFRHHNPAARERVKRIMGLGAVEEERRLEPAIFDPAPPRPAPPRRPVTMVLPVYNAFDLLRRGAGPAGAPQRPALAPGAGRGRLDRSPRAPLPARLGARAAGGAGRADRERRRTSASSAR